MSIADKENSLAVENAKENEHRRHLELMESQTPSERQFALIQRQARVYSSSAMVPNQYQGEANIGSVIIAMNMANRLGADVLQVMQNLDIIHGKPGWSAKFLIATLNQCGKFSPVRYRFTGEKGTDSWGCIAVVKSLDDGEVLEGTEVTIKIAKDEGWYSKHGSKWQTMPEQMLRYRAASWMIRTVAPEVSMGLMSQEEIHDIGPELKVTQIDLKSESVGNLPSGNPSPSVSDKDLSASDGNHIVGPDIVGEFFKKIGEAETTEEADALLDEYLERTEHDGTKDEFREAWNKRRSVIESELTKAKETLFRAEFEECKTVEDVTACEELLLRSNGEHEAMIAGLAEELRGKVGK